MISQNEKAISREARRQRRFEGQPWIVVESDGSFVGTGELQPDPGGGLSPQRQHAKQRWQTRWREVRLSTVQVPQAAEKQYAGAAFPSPGRRTDVGPGHQGWLWRHTWVHGVGDGAHWIAQQMAELFPKHHYLLDRYHLLQHLYAGDGGLPDRPGETAKEWVQRQVSQIDQGGVSRVIADCRAGGGTISDHPLNQLAGYLEHQQGHLNYALARNQGLPMGSGAVEGGHRHVIQAMLKLPRTWWKEDS